jgi:hypothetical protein
MSNPAQPPKAVSFLASVVGMTAGWGLSFYAGPVLWLPAAALLALWFLLTRATWRPRHFPGAIAVTGAHVVWFLLASAATRNWTATLPDILLLSAGIGWIWQRPGMAPALMLGLVQLWSLAYNGYLLSAHAFGSPDHKALTVHFMLRLIALIALATGWHKLRQDRRALPTPPPLPK